MKALLDIGNTRIKWRMQGEPETEQAVAIAQWQSLLPLLKQAGVRTMHASCVAGQAWQDEFAQACEQVLGFAPNYASVVNGAAGLQLAYAQPRTLGVDRWLAMLAARGKAPAVAVVVISAGTAITVDMVEASGRHLGGLIIPGLQLSVNALDRGTGKIGHHPIELMNQWAPGDSTRECVINGISSMVTGFLLELCRHKLIAHEHAAIFLSGGDAPHLAALMPPQVRYELAHNLVLDGLAIIAEGHI